MSHCLVSPKKKIVKFQRTYSPTYRLQRSGSSDSQSSNLSTFYMKIHRLGIEREKKQTDDLKRLNQMNPMKGSIRAKRLKFTHNEQSTTKVRQCLTKESLVEAALCHFEEQKKIEKLNEQNKDLKQKIQVMSDQIQELKSIINNKNNPQGLEATVPSTTFLSPHNKPLNTFNNSDPSFCDQITNISHINCGSSYLSDFNLKNCKQMAEELKQTRKELDRAQVMHNFELRKLNKELDFYKNHKDKELLMLKQKLNEVLRKYKEVSKKAASLEIQCLLNKKTRGNTQAENMAQCQKDYEQFYALSSDDDNTPSPQ